MQKGLVALEVEAVVREEAREKMLAGKKTDPVEIFPQGSDAKKKSTGKTRDKLAEAVGISHGTLDKVKAIRDTAPADIYEKALTGEISVSKAAMLIN